VRRITLDEGGFIISQDGVESGSIKWDSVIEIMAWKDDLFTVDEIAVGFRSEDDGGMTIIRESDEGFIGVQSDFESRFDDIADDWWSNVAFPPFAENPTTIWKRAS
jgi:hypothetical protein